MDDLIREMLEPERPAPGVVARRRRFVATLSIIGLAALGVTSLTTNALFTDQADTAQSGFVSGSVKLDAEGAEFTMPAGFLAAPGDHYYAPITVTNTGTLELRYAFSIEGKSDNTTLLENLDYTIIYNQTETQCNNRSGAPPSGDTYPSGTLGTSSHWIGQGTTGPVPGDRTLAGGGNNTSEVICVALSFNPDAGNDTASSSASLEFAFYAEQTANNP